MNRRIQKKRDMPSVRRAYAAMGLGVDSKPIGVVPTVIIHRSMYTSIDLSTPAARRELTKHQRHCEMVRCRRAMLRRMRRAVRRLVVPGTRVRWVEVSGARGPMGRIYLMPKGTAVALANQCLEDKLVMRELTPDQARWKMYTTKLVQLPWRKSLSGLIS